MLRQPGKSSESGRRAAEIQEAAASLQAQAFSEYSVRYLSGRGPGRPLLAQAFEEQGLGADLWLPPRAAGARRHGPEVRRVGRPVSEAVSASGAMAILENVDLNYSGSELSAASPSPSNSEEGTDSSRILEVRRAEVGHISPRAAFARVEPDFVTDADDLLGSPPPDRSQVVRLGNNADGANEQDMLSDWTRRRKVHHARMRSCRNEFTVQALHGDRLPPAAFNGFTAQQQDPPPCSQLGDNG